MYLTPDTTAILVADRRSAREAAARQHRTLLTRFRQALPTRQPAPARLPATTGRTPVAGTPQAA